MPNKQEKETFLLAEYDFLSRAYEVHFSHFMGVFYFWVAVIGAPTTASAIAEPILYKVPEPVSVGAIWLGAGLLGSFLTWKLYDLRASQFRYIVKMNELRARFWRVFKIEKNESLQMLGNNDNIEDVPGKDFGVKMAWSMSVVNGILIAVGAFLWSPFQLPSTNLFLGLALWLLASGINLFLYYPMVVWKIKEFLPAKKKPAA